MKTKVSIKYPLLGSSVDATKVSLTIKAVLGFVVTILVGFGFNQVDLDGIANDIVTLSEILFQGIFLVMGIYGGIRKIWVNYKK